MSERRRPPCPFCSAPVRTDASSCPYCGRCIAARLSLTAPLNDARSRYHAAKRLTELLGPTVAFGELIRRLGKAEPLVDGLTRADAEVVVEDLGKLGIAVTAEFFDGATPAPPQRS